MLVNIITLCWKLTKEELETLLWHIEELLDKKHKEQ